MVDYVLMEDGLSFWLSVLWIVMKNIYGIGDIFLVCIVVELVKGMLLEVVIVIGK